VWQKQSSEVIKLSCVDRIFWIQCGFFFANTLFPFPKHFLWVFRSWLCWNLTSYCCVSAALKKVGLFWSWKCGGVFFLNCCRFWGAVAKDVVWRLNWRSALLGVTSLGFPQASEWSHGLGTPEPTSRNSFETSNSFGWFLLHVFLNGNLIRKLHRVIELEGTHMDHWVQLPASHSTTQNPNLMSESAVQMLPELWHWDYAHCTGQPVLCPLPSGEEPFLNPHSCCLDVT